MSQESFVKTRHLRFPWDRESIEQHAPDIPGVYGLFGALWIYVAEADDLRTEMLAKLASDDPCLKRYRPSGFAFEVISKPGNTQRRAELIEQLQPICQYDPRRRGDRALRGYGN